ncbi:prepilin peptidase [Corynebacterium sp. UBA2622]|uniref:prepilin peptidase n=1 Tax=Corynebacterium sp. UBA2622 TaxID=1946393 RepID=UPI0025B8F303|nr:prepilin peptidase [Corynebacterium sp. UBA2622]
MLIGGSASFFTCAAGVIAAAWSAVLVHYDLRSHRLPDALTLPAGAAALASCAAWPEGLWGLAWPALYLLVGRGIGGGDIKLSLPLGVAVAALASPPAILAAVGVSSALTLAAAAVLRARGAPHGPSMLAAAWLCVLMGSFPAQL